MTTKTYRLPRYTELHRAALETGTLQKYFKATSAFYTWAIENGETANDLHEFDLLLSDWICELYYSGGSRSTGVNAVWGILHFLVSIKGDTKFPMAQLSLRGWKKRSPSVPWSPITWELACTISYQFMRMGRADYAIATLVAFDAMFRIGETTSILVSDVGIDGKDIGVHLRKTKTGPDKFARILRPEVQQIFRSWLRTRPPTAKVFDFSASSYRRAFRAVCDSFGLNATFVPHSLRHGGATDLFERTKDLHLVMHYGRWAVESSARHYIQDGRALVQKATGHIPPSTLAAARLICSDIIGALRYAAHQAGVGLLL